MIEPIPEYFKEKLAARKEELTNVKVTPGIFDSNARDYINGRLGEVTDLIRYIEEIEESNKSNVLNNG